MNVLIFVGALKPVQQLDLMYAALEAGKMP